MCAINGVTEKNEAVIRAMNEATTHRGPDQSGTYFSPDISFGHNRLSIIDLSERGRQPMQSADQQLTIVFNGEIYNFRELRKELEGRYSFVSQSDTEVILAAYQTWGAESFKKLRGMFAFAIRDHRRRETVIVRDPVGIKPLYYSVQHSTLFFSSEIKGLLAAGIPRRLSFEALHHYLRLLYVPGPLTMFADILKLPPGHYGIWKDNQLSLVEYVPHTHPEPLTRPFNAIAQELREVVQTAVTRQLISDRPLGVYLSGGIDSSVVLDCMTATHKDIETFSVGFDLGADEQREKFNADFDLARRTARYYQTRHHELRIATHDVPTLFEKAVWHMDEPISNPTSIAMQALADYTKQDVAVALAGDGGDELFGGYERYRTSVRMDYWQTLPAGLRRIFSFGTTMKKLNTARGLDRYALFMFQKDATVNRILGDSRKGDDTATRAYLDRYFQNSSTADATAQLMDADRQTWLVDFALMLADKMSMSAGLEVRVPLLDQEVIEFAARIPRAYKVNMSGTKQILKAAFRGRIPDFLLHQPKRGWFAPGAKWLRNTEVQSFARALLSQGYYAPTQDIFDWSEISSMLEQHIAKKAYHLNTLWALMTFQNWARAYKVVV